MAHHSISNPLRKGPPGPADVIDTIDPRSQPHTMDDTWDIGEALSRLALGGDAVTLHGAGAPVLARVLAVDDEQEQYTLELNDTLDGGPVTCVAYLHSAKLQFTLDPGWQAEPLRPDCIVATFPAACLVLERRGDERQETPVGLRYLATFVTDGKPFELQLVDFSLGGVGMRAAPHDAESLYVGRKLQRVRLDLGPDLVLVADLEIRLKRSFRTFLAGRQVQVGCQFVNLTGAQRDDLRRVRLRLEQLRTSR